jgi:hypothetical protein
MTNCTIADAEFACVVDDYETHEDIVNISQYIIKNWEYAHDIFGGDSLARTPLYKSKQEVIDDVGFNFWYCPRSTDCAIHNKHPFREVHTQILGIGKMQVFHDSSYSSLQHEVILAPGTTHDPFYDDQGKYPWHQYQGVTDCIWLAVEFY